MTMVRHDAPIRIRVHSGIWGDYNHDTTADLVDAALAVEAIKHGKVSGYEGTAARCTYDLELLDAAFELKDGELCECDRCVNGEPS